MRNFLSRIFSKDQQTLDLEMLAVMNRLATYLAQTVEELSKVRQKQNELTNRMQCQETSLVMLESQVQHLETSLELLEDRQKRAERVLLPLTPLGPNGVQELHLPSELRLDLSEVQSLIPLEKRINISEDS